MDHTQSRVTVFYGVHDDADREDIVDLVQRLVLVQHLLINTEEVLDASVDLAPDLRVLHVGLDLGDNVIDEFLARFACQGNLFFQFFVYIWLEIP